MYRVRNRCRVPGQTEVCPYTAAIEHAERRRTIDCSLPKQTGSHTRVADFAATGRSLVPGSGRHKRVGLSGKFRAEDTDRSFRIVTFLEPTFVGGSLLATGALKSAPEKSLCGYSHSYPVGGCGYLDCLIASKLPPTITSTPQPQNKKPPRRAVLCATDPYYNFGPAALIASLTSNFLKFSMNRPARPLAASS